MATIEPTPQRLSQFLQAADDGSPVVMLNLLRYRDQAAYPEGSGASPCSGREAYGRYSEAVLPLLQGVGGRPVWGGAAWFDLIAPEGESWHDAVLVEYPSRQAFLSMVGSAAYQAISFHRSAALADSRLIALRAAGSLAPS